MLARRERGSDWGQLLCGDGIQSGPRSWNEVQMEPKVMSSPEMLVRPVIVLNEMQIEIERGVPLIFLRIGRKF